MKKWGSFFLVLALLSTLAGHGMAETADRTEEQLYNELIVGTSTAITGQFFTNAFGNNTADIDVRMLLHGYHLVRWNGENCAFSIDQAVVSGLVAVEEEGDKQYIIALAQDLQYCDGTPITARDFVFSILLSASKEMAALGNTSISFAYIQGAEEYLAGETNVLTGVRLLGEHQFSITINSDYLPFFYEMGWLDFCPYPIAEIAPGCQIKDDGEGAYIANLDESVKSPVFSEALLRETILTPETGYLSHPKVTSGAYQLASYDAANQEVTFVPNPYFKADTQGKRPTIPLVKYTYVEPSAMVDGLGGGTVDLLNKCVPADVIQAGLALAAQGMAGQSSYPRSGLSFISFACEKGPAQFQAVRQAMALCLDRDQFVADSVKSFGVKVNGYYGMGQWMQQLVEGVLPPPMEELPENASPQQIQEQEQALAQWSTLSLGALDPYALDLERAKRLLIQDGWTLNEAGKPFDEAKDRFRVKKVDKKLMPLALSLLASENTGIEKKLVAWQANLASIGVELTIQSQPYENVLSQYYRQTPRVNDLFFVGSNFLTLYDPSGTYSTQDEQQGVMNTTGLRDEKLMALAMDMRRTESGDLLTYCQKWIAFQEYWNEVLPMIPLYSNMYFDFYTPRLQGYSINQHITWSEALSNAYLSNAAEQEDLTVEDGAPVGGIPMGGTPLGEE